MKVFLKNKFIPLILSVCLLITLIPLASIEALPTSQTKINSWQWVDEEDRLIKVDDHWELVIGDASEADLLTKEKLKSLLPSSILVEVVNHQEEVTDPVDHDTQEVLEDDSDKVEQEIVENQDVIADQEEQKDIENQDAIKDQEIADVSENLENHEVEEVVENEENLNNQEIIPSQETLDDQEQAKNEPFTQPSSFKTQEVSKNQELLIDWDFADYPEEGTDTGSYILTASLPENYILEDGVQPLEVILKFTKASEHALSKEDLASHIVYDIVHPAGTTVNLFDYWVDNSGESPVAPNGDILSKESVAHQREDGSSAKFSAFENWNRGINKDHLLIFGDGVIHGGLWNKGAGENTNYGKSYAGMEGIVKLVLEDGYPAINIADARQRLLPHRDYTLVKDWKLADDHGNGQPTNYNSYGAHVQNLSETIIANWESVHHTTLADGKESLNYLFDPSISHSYKKSYENVTGLFQIDEDGYYYYNMRENFAEFQQGTTRNSDGHFVLYDAPATIRTDATSSVGNFFPFNQGTEVFSGIDAQGKLTSNVKCSNNTMNHHMGMTVEVNFRQPIDGMINMGVSGNQPMTFQFSGDDDVWIFIDDVLVLDLGGVHSEIYGIIDFSNGNVLVGRGFNSHGIPDYDWKHPEATQDLVTSTTIRQLFKDAGMENRVSWRENSFASNTSHTLKMFYLERGNYDSSIALRFNLMPQLYQQIKKVDQNGNSMKGVEFQLYEAVARLNSDGETVYEAVGDPLATLLTDENGLAQFKEKETDQNVYAGNNERPFNFADRYTDQGIQYYILKETKTPAGYRSLPIDIALRYDHDNTMLEVLNTWTTGAYSSFTSTISGNSHITYGAYDVSTGNIQPGSHHVSASKQQDGLVLAIPMLKQVSRGNSWHAVYGSNISGFHTVSADDKNVFEWRKSVLCASLYQMADDLSSTPKWYLKWDSDNRRLEGTLSELPGMANRYQLTNDTNADMKMVYGIIEPKAFETLGIYENTAEKRYQALGSYVRHLVEEIQRNDPKLPFEEALDQAILQTANEIMSVEVENTGSGLGFSFLNVDQFVRNFRSLIYIPNEQRELRVLKVNEDGQAINGAVFGLFDHEDASGTPIVTGVTANVDGQDGMLIFSPVEHAQAGYAKIEWANSTNTEYYLKEISAPEGYKVNPTVIPVIVGIYSIYADAGTADDGVTVMAGVGKLFQTMTKYASDGEINITLRDIRAFAQVQPSGQFNLYGWQDLMLEGTNVNRYLNLHYGRNAVVDYGLHDEDGGQYFKPYFVTDTGFIRTRVQQNHDALNDELYEGAENTTRKEDLKDKDITSLFSLLNIVVVSDAPEVETKTGELTISKKVTGENLNDEDYSRLFEFDVILLNHQGQPLDGTFYFYGTDKSGFIESGNTILLHHDESITILGLPEGTTYKIIEHVSEGYYSIPSDGSMQGMILDDVQSVANFVNVKGEETTPYKGNLEIKKTVVGQNIDTNCTFNFKVILKDQHGRMLNGQFAYQGSKTGMLSSGDVITLRHHENIVLMDLPEGTVYEVIESASPGYWSTSQNDRGTIVSHQTSSAQFYNVKQDDHLEIGHLMIQKTISGSESETERLFTFKVMFRDQHGQELMEGYAFSGSHEGMIHSGDEIYLKGGESIIIQGLPAGTRYVVEEVEANQEGYVTGVLNPEGVLEKDQLSVVHFNNHRGPETPPDLETPTTGDMTMMNHWKLCCLCSFAFLVLLYKRKKKHA